MTAGKRYLRGLIAEGRHPEDVSSRRKLSTLQLQVRLAPPSGGPCGLVYQVVMGPVSEALDSRDKNAKSESERLECQSGSDLLCALDKSLHLSEPWS